MHFPRFVLKGCIIGAALFFPSVALADKNDHVPAPNGNKTLSVLSNMKTNGNGNNSNKSEEHLKKEPNRVKQNENHNQKPLSKETKKIGKAFKKPFTKKIEHGRKMVSNPGLKKGIFKTNIKTSVTQKKQPEQMESSKVDVQEKSLPILKPNDRKKVTIAVHKNRNVLKGKRSLTKKIFDANKLDSEKKKSVPSSNKSLPQDFLIITTTALGGNNLTDTSKDRSNLGTNTMNVTVWLEWERYRLPNFNQSYISRSYELSSQWTNAPPIQPPKSFLF